MKQYGGTKKEVKKQFKCEHFWGGELETDALGDYLKCPYCGTIWRGMTKKAFINCRYGAATKEPVSEACGAATNQDGVCAFGHRCETCKHRSRGIPGCRDSNTDAGYARYMKCSEPYGTCQWEAKE